MLSLDMRFPTLNNALRGLIYLAACFGSLTYGQSYDLAEAAAAATDRQELDRTWAQAWFNLPRVATESAFTPIIGPFGSDYVQRRLAALPADRLRPVVVILHGCAGIGSPERNIERILTQLGFAVLFPNSMSRRLRPRDCDASSGAWGMFPLVDLFRRAEMIDAMARLSELPWVDSGNLFLAGIGEGAVTVALWGGEVNATGYLIAGWTCTAPPELGWLGRLRTPVDRPVLAVVSRNDPHYRLLEFQGDCAQQGTAEHKVVSHIIDGSVHNVFVYPETVGLVVDFMLAHTRSDLVPSPEFRALRRRLGNRAEGAERFDASDLFQESGMFVETPVFSTD